ncbi:uncharacterized protein LOC131019817 [Salvia miltiorrhiza]|uniref:uncharacterized protein LOC131019817 n=1 Tax=Salvia miltiorrhiza TaxID=226208 RepID=UPI0025AD9BB8|nr:uncharacterized protein LOC131019817 [Salvia miltiorrhiza]XP_057804406.1 uncharacterized protein LOC131019817 [Salvia miltiorrhiza]XP_057804407.1 uncharacterized protein LOC131019817 [Salvia miltiorrhiza]XP_057804408.1 uncharacterized protein LOC131019817 [Salvia miltiorrhiza]XP_057804409.1 uncharacterized protein LOC131019817 [Salvia miltiorrhiza]
MKDELLGDENIDRAIMWKKARLKKDGSVENEDLKKVVEKIDERLREKEQGDSTKVDDGKEDLLTSILKKSEHSGRVQAVGDNVYPTAFFNLPKEKRQKLDEKVDKQELIEARHEWKNMMGELLSRIGNLESTLKARDKLSVEKGSCSVKYPHDPIEYEKDDDGDDDDVVCIDSEDIFEGKYVALKKKGTRATLAYGTVIVAGPMLHGAPMPKNARRVSVDEVVADNENELLPYPVSEEILTVGSGIGNTCSMAERIDGRKR